MNLYSKDKEADQLFLRTRMGRFARNMNQFREAQKRIGLWRRSGKSPKPYMVWVEPTNKCNLKCPKCPQASGIGRPPVDMALDKFREIIDQIKSFKPILGLHHSGEPFMHGGIFNMIEYARSAGLETLISTNATLIHKENFRIAGDGPTALTFSIDASNAADYEALHPGAPWERIERNVAEYFDNWKKTANPTQTYLKIVAGPANRHKVNEIITAWSKYPFALVEVDEQFEWPVTDEDVPIPVVPRGWKAFPCPAPWNWAAVLSNGTFAPCCYDAMGLFGGGNFLEEGFDAIWSGEKVEAMRRYVFDPANEKPVSPCRSCVQRAYVRKMGFVRSVAYHSLPLWKPFAKYSL